mgnify:CR=1 FL=1
MKNLRVAACCMNSVVGDISGNSEKMCAIIRKASDSDLILFPELCLTGYAMPRSMHFCLDEDSYEISKILDCSSENGIIICFGYADREHHIRQVVAENGCIVGRYDKTHLGEREINSVIPGNTLEPICTSKVRLGIQICWESHFPEITGTYALKGADIILMPHASGLTGTRRKTTWDRIMPARAYDNTVFTISCNATGDNGLGTCFGGGSCILDPRGRILAEDYSGSSIIFADLDGTEMESIRSHKKESMSNLYFLDKRRPEIYFR